MDVSRETLMMIFGEERIKDDLLGVIEEISSNPDGYRQKVWSLYAGKKHEDEEICKKCGGKCCKNAPCHFAPGEFNDLSVEGLKKFLKKNTHISIVRHSSSICECIVQDFRPDGPYYYTMRMRARGTNTAVPTAEINKEQTCVMLTNKGCKLPYEKRGMGAKLLIPKADGKCEQLYGMDECVHDWKEYQKVLREVYQYFERRQRKWYYKLLKYVHL